MAARSVVAACQLGMFIQQGLSKRACHTAIVLTVSQEGNRHCAVVHGPKRWCAWRKGMLLDNVEGTAALLWNSAGSECAVAAVAGLRGWRARHPEQQSAPQYQNHLHINQPCHTHKLNSSARRCSHG